MPLISKSISINASSLTSVTKTMGSVVTATGWRRWPTQVATLWRDQKRLCVREVAMNKSNIQKPVYWTNNKATGDSLSPVFSFGNFDLCQNCLSITVISASVCEYVCAFVCTVTVWWLVSEEQLGLIMSDARTHMMKYQSQLFTPCARLTYQYSVKITTTCAHAHKHTRGVTSDKM